MTNVPHGKHPGSDELRAKRDTWLARQLEFYGQERYDQIQHAVEVIGEELCRRVDPLVDEARSRNFLEFSSRVDDSKFAPAIRIEFGDPKGNYYVRSFGLDKLMKQHGCPLGWQNFINDKLYIHVLKRSGMEVIRGRMKKLTRSELSRLPTLEPPTAK